MRHTARTPRTGPASYRGGVSLLELLIYVAVLAAIAVVVVSAVLALADTYARLRITQHISDSAAVALERIARDTRAASRVDVAASTLGTHPGTLVLERSTESGTVTTTFYLDGGRVKVDEGGSTIGALTREEVTVTDLVFFAATSTSAQAVRTRLTIEGTNGDITKTETFYGGAALRGAY